MKTIANNPRGIPDDLACLAAPNSTPHPTAEPEDRFPLLSLIALMSIILIAAILNNSLVMLVSALLPTPLLVWQLFMAIDDWEDRRAAARKRTEATSTTNNAASPATAAAPQPTSI